MWWILNPSDLSDLQTRFLSDSDLIFVLVRLNFRKINYRKTGCDRWGRMEQFAHISEIDPLRCFSVRFKKSNLGYVSDDIQCSCFWHNKMGWNISLQLHRIFVFFFQIRRLCKVVYRKFDFARYPGHVRDPFTYAFKPIIIHVSLCMCLSRCLYFCCDDAMQAQR